MPLFPHRPAQQAPSLNPERCDSNGRVLIIGVTDYDQFPDRPVRGAVETALSWVVVALRLGMSPYHNPPALNGLSHEQYVERVAAAVASSDLDDQERGVQQQAALRSRLPEPSGWNHPVIPTYQNVLRCLIYEANHMEYTGTCRLLLAFAGHGVLVRGVPALCPQDAEKGGPAPLAGAQEARLAAAVQSLRVRDLGACAEELDRMGKVALRKKVLEELLDLLQAPLTEGLSADVLLALLRFVARNLERLPAQRAAGTAEYSRVIRPVHLQLCLGEHARRTTLVLDACNSGGLGQGLQGSMDGHAWSQAGLQARILSAASSGQVAAETRIGGRRQGAATWALTTVLSRWNAVPDGEGWAEAAAFNLRNGDLVYRANQLLSSLSFRQQVSLHAPAPRGLELAAADMPFFGLDRRTRTVVDPTAENDSIQISSDTLGVAAAWLVKQSGAVKAVMVAIPSGSAWTWPAGGTTYGSNTFSIRTNSTAAGDLADASFSLEMYTWALTGGAPSQVTSALDTFATGSLKTMPASGDPDERAWDSAKDPAPADVWWYQKAAPPGGNPGDMVFLRWKKDAGTARRLWIISNAPFPYTQADFAGGGSSMGFQSGNGQNISFGQGTVVREISLI